MINQVLCRDLWHINAFILLSKRWKILPRSHKNFELEIKKENTEVLTQGKSKPTGRMWKLQNEDHGVVVSFLAFEGEQCDIWRHFRVITRNKSPYNSPYNSPYKSLDKSPYNSPENSPYKSPYKSPFLLLIERFIAKKKQSKLFPTD